MTTKDIIKQLAPGTVAGLVLGFAVNYAIGVNPEVAPNIIGGALAAAVPVTLNSLVLLKTSRGATGRSVPARRMVKMMIPLVIFGGICGAALAALIHFGVTDITQLSRWQFTIVYAIIGVILQNIMGVILLKRL